MTMTWNIKRMSALQPAIFGANQEQDDGILTAEDRQDRQVAW